MTSAANNPLLQPWNTVHGLPPFRHVRPEHFAPAFDVGLAEHLAEIEHIGGNSAAPSFDNTIAALDRGGRVLDRVASLFYNLTSSETSPQPAAQEKAFRVRRREPECNLR